MTRIEDTTARMLDVPPDAGPVDAGRGGRSRCHLIHAAGATSDASTDPARKDVCGARVRPARAKRDTAHSPAQRIAVKAAALGVGGAVGWARAAPGEIT